MIGLYVLVTHGLYIWLAILATKKAARIVTEYAGRTAGYIAVIGLIAIFVLIPIWDELLSLPKYYKLCRTEAGVHVYGKMNLPKELYSKTGEPLFIHDNGDIDGYFNRRWNYDKTELYKYVRFDRGENFINTTQVPIKKTWDCAISRVSNRKLACVVVFGTTKGWWSKIFFTDFRQLIQTSSCSRIDFDFPVLQRKIFARSDAEND